VTQLVVINPFFLCQPIISIRDNPSSPFLLTPPDLSISLWNTRPLELEPCPLLLPSCRHPLAKPSIPRMRSFTPRTSSFPYLHVAEKTLKMRLGRWGLCILCLLLIGALITSYYLQIKRIRAVHETVVSIFAGMVVGLVIRLSPGHLIREMLVRRDWFPVKVES
jgi:hypothetical protein